MVEHYTPSGLRALSVWETVSMIVTPQPSQRKVKTDLMMIVHDMENFFSFMRRLGSLAQICSGGIKSHFLLSLSSRNISYLLEPYF